MSAKPVAILGSGMMTGVGLTAAASCAAIRAGIDNFAETRFIDTGGEWILGCEVPLDQPWRGHARLLRLLAGAVGECLDQAGGIPAEHIPLLLCTAEPSRPGVAAGAATRLFVDLQSELGVRFHGNSRVVEEGRVGAAWALDEARRLIHAGVAERVILAGVDSLLSAAALRAYEERYRLLTAANSDGFIAGEAGAAVLLGPAGAEVPLACLGLGFGQETATVDSEETLRADGLTQAIKAALADSGIAMEDTDFRLADVSGEQYGFKETTLAVARTLRVLKPEYDIWHPADCIGEVGAAALPCMVGVALAAAYQGYTLGPTILCHVGGDDGARAAFVLTATAGTA